MDKGYDIHLVTSTSKPIKGVKTHELKFPLARNAYFRSYATFPLRIWKIRKTIEKIKPKVLHAFYITNYGFCGALLNFHPFIVSIMGSDVRVNPHESIAKRAIIKFAFKKADVVHTHTLQDLLTNLGCKPSKILVQEWGVNTRSFSPRARSASLRRRLGLNDNYSILSARFWKKQYNVEVLIRAIPLVLKEIKNVKLILLGGGPLEYKLKKSAKNLNIYDNIVWIGGVPEEEMSTYLASIDIYVDTLGGIGQTTRQVMACGTSCISSSITGMEEINYFSGLLYKPKSHQDLAEKIIYLLNNDRIRNELGKKSRQNALRVFSMDNVMEKWERIYSKIGQDIQ